MAGERACCRDLRRLARFSAALSALLLASCTRTPAKHGGAGSDSTPTADTGGTDSTAADSGARDTSPADSGVVDYDGDGVPAGVDCDDWSASIGAPQTWFRDADGDDFGDPTVSATACTQPDGHVADNTDCDDTNGVVNPGEQEYCDGFDDDCDGLIDDNDPSVQESSWWPDADGDGYGTGAGTPSCSSPAGSALHGGDCDETNPAINPGVDEVCDGIDNNCDGVIDEYAVDAGTWYLDADGDGFGVTEGSLTACAAPAGYVAVDGDCDDGDATVTACSRYTYTGDEQTYTVPDGVSSLTIEAWGGGGGGLDSTGNYGGGGGYATQPLDVTPGDVLTLRPGEGGPGTGGGGGGTFVWDGAGTLVLVAGGGGGAWSGGIVHGGGGGGETGSDGGGGTDCVYDWWDYTGLPGGGGTQSSGGTGGYTYDNNPDVIWAPAADAAGGFEFGGGTSGAALDIAGVGPGGGGSGYYGGGAGGEGVGCTSNTGGGGGSSWTTDGSTLAADWDVPGGSGVDAWDGLAGDGGYYSSRDAVAIPGGSGLIVIY